MASVAWRAVPAWICPPRHLHDRPARMRSSLATALVAWSMLTGLGLVFAQLTQFQGFTAPGHPEVRWAYAVFDVSLALSALVAGFGGLPLWLLMLRRAWRERRPRDMVYLLLPLIAPAAYLAALIVTIRLVGRAERGGPWWFLVVVLAGFAAAATAAAGPGLALRRLQPRGPALRVAAAAAGVAADRIRSCSRRSAATTSSARTRPKPSSGDSMSCWRNFGTAAVRSSCWSCRCRHFVTDLARPNAGWPSVTGHSSSRSEC